MDIDFYYRDPDKMLHTICCAGVESVEEGKTHVMEFLHKEQAVFLLPLLGLIQGGKA